MINRKLLVQIHMYLAAFIFPAVLMFLSTGALYTWGIKGSYNTETYNIALQTPLSADQVEMLNIVNHELKKLNITEPTGHHKIKSIGTNFRMEWTGSNRDITLEPTQEPLIAKLTIKNTSSYRQLVQLHKAKGGTLFKVYAAFTAIALLVLLISGYIMALQVKKLRNPVLYTRAAVLLIFIIVVTNS